MRKQILVLLVLAFSALSLTAQSFNLDSSLFDAPYLKKMIEPDAFFKPLSPPVFVAVKDFASRSVPGFLRDDDWCIAIDQGGASYVYPVPVMIWHEVANAPAASGQNLCVSYCILTGTGLAFDPQFNGLPKLDFGVSGYLYQSNLVMFDYQSRTLWSQVGLRADGGKLKGKAITPLRYSFVRWSQAKQNPDALVCLGSTSDPKIWARYAKAPMESLDGYPENDAIRAPVAPAALADQSHPAKELFVYFPAKNRAVSLHSLAEKDVAGINAVRSGGKLLSISSPEAFITVYWFALRAFYPDATIQ